MVISGLGSTFTYTGGTSPGTGGTCGSSLSGGSSCTVNLSFGAAYQHTDALSVFTDWRITFVDFATSDNIYRSYLGVLYARGNMLDFALRAGFADLTETDSFGLGVLARLRI